MGLQRPVPAGLTRLLSQPGPMATACRRQHKHTVSCDQPTLAAPWLLPRLWPPQRHPARSGARIQPRSSHQPRRAHTPAAPVRAAHPTHHLADCRRVTVERRQVGNRERPFTGTATRQAIDHETEPRQFEKWAGQDRKALATSGGIGGCPRKNI